MQIIKKRDRPFLAGSHVWAEWFLAAPRYVLWNYVGFNLNLNGEKVYWFHRRKQPAQIGLTVKEIMSKANFRPFCVVTDELLHTENYDRGL